MRCPCRKKSETVDYTDCCQPLHVGTGTAATAEALMRSRYAAFVREDAAYLMRTWHPTTRPSSITFTPGQEWQLLRILATSTEGGKATVEFSARSRLAGKSSVLHEVSRFVTEDGNWLYLDGEIRSQ